MKFLIVFFFLFGINSVASYGQGNTCKKAFHFYKMIEDGFTKGNYLYPPKKVKACCANAVGNPIYKIKGKNKSILYLINYTGIKCEESEDGVFSDKGRFISLEKLACEKLL